MTTPAAPSISVRQAITLTVLAASLTLALYAPTFRNSWAFDDISYINTSANVLAGRLSLGSALLLAHNEHVVPAFRLLFLLYLKLFGLNVVVWRVMTALVHAASAVFVALLAWRYSGKARAAIAAVITYAGSCGFSSMFLWFPSGAAVPLSFAALTGAAALLAWRNHLRTRRIIAGIAVVVALLTWRSFAPMAFLPAIIDEFERRREGARGRIGAFSFFCLGAVVSAVLAGRGLITEHVESSARHGFTHGLFLLLVAPFRFFFPGLSIAGDDSGRSTAILGITLGIAVAAAAATLLAVLWRRGVPSLARVAALSAIPPIAVLFLIGLYRFRVTFLELYELDRYFYPLLIPVALLAGAVTASISPAGWPRLARFTLALALGVGIAGEIGLHRRAMLRLVPFETYAANGRGFAALASLANRLERAGPIELPHDRIWYAGMNDRVDSAVLTNILSDGKRLHLGGAHIDAPRLNGLLDAWAREIGEPVPFIRVIDGRLINSHFPTTIDFRRGSFDGSILGFQGWEQPFRWMGRRGALFVMLGSSDLTLSLAAPLSDLRRTHPDWSSIPVQVSLVDVETGFMAPLGVVEITEDGVHEYRLSTSPMTSRGGIGLIVQITLDCDRVWKPSEVYGAADGNERTIQLFSAGTRFSP